MMNVKRMLAGCLVSLAALMTTGCDLLEPGPPNLDGVSSRAMFLELIERGFTGLEDWFDDDE